jgi:ATP-dependent Clp protease ATP-binding subunit ClpA
VKITVPIIIQKQPQQGIAPSLHILRPLFHPYIEARGEDLNRAMTKLAKELRRECDRLSREMRHDELARYSFSPDLEDHFFKFQLEMADRRAKCNFLVVAFKSLDRKIAFTPSVPDLWFEVLRGETLADRAAEVLTNHFRQKEKRDGREALRPEALSVEGKAWVTTLEISINLPSLAQPPKQDLFALLGGGEKMYGADELDKTGRCLDYLYPDDLSRAIFREEEVAELTAILQGLDRRPVMVTGKRLAGKTAIIHEYVYRRVEQRHSKFSSKSKVWLLSPQRLISGMSYVGQWENRLLAILKEAKEQNHILYFDDLLGLYQAGQTSNSTLSAADVLKPYVEKRQVRVLGEITPEAFRVLQERDRNFADMFHLLNVKETSEDKTFRILLRLMRQLEHQHHVSFSTEVFPTVMDLQRRYGRDAAFPGKAALFLQQLAVKFRNEKVSREDVLKQFYAKSGLSLTFLNDQTKLARQEVMDAISKEVIGQNAAIEACADVISIAKARLNDTERPLASFLFLGTTGVGKTQCAKSLANYLFGDAEKLLRFDMNEYSSAYSVARLVGTFNQPEGLLTSAVQRQPFSIVLLDEIEKAHPDVFNLLLQVMGDGRLTDALGRTVDFTNSIIILTSNLGVREAGKNLGFRNLKERESHIYIQAAEKFFKPEFFNRLDRIVPFERLTREDVNRIAQGLIQNIFAREGLMRRKCVLQIDERAMQRIIDEGYDPQLGARALKRMLERQVTQPVAARLAALKPDAPTVIQVLPVGEALDVIVDALQGAESNHHNLLLIELTAPQRLIAAVEDLLGRVEEEIQRHEPQGLINPGDLSSEHLTYFQIKEQARRLREMCRRVESRSNISLERFASRSRGRSISKRQFTLRQTQTTDLWQQMLDAVDLHTLLKEIAAAAPPHGESLKDYLAELLREAALLKTLAQAGEEEANNRILLVIRAAEQGQKKECEWLAKSYQALFEHKLEMRVTRLPESEELRALQAEALLIHGIGASQIAAAEAGTHLFYLPQGRLAPMQVNVLSLGEQDEQTALREVAEKNKNRLHRTEGDGNGESSALPLVVRVYEADGVTLDLRSRLLTLKPPTAEELRAFLLAMLPLPDEVDESLR